MRDNESDIEEQPATHKTKTQYYLMALIGAVFVVLIGATIWGIVKRSGQEEEKKQDNDTQIQEGERAPRNEFDSLINDKSYASESSFSSSNNRQQGNQNPNVQTYEQGGTTPNQNDERYEKMQSQISQIVQYLQDKEDGDNGNSVKSKIQDFEASELERALAARSAEWNFGENQKGNSRGQTSSNGTGKSEEDVINQPWESDPDDISARRKEVQARIKKIQELRAKRTQENKRRGNEVQSSAQQYANMSRDSDAIEELESQFNEPPEDVAGYGEANKYNADIAGKMKLSPGSIIPFTSQWKAISDYLDSPMKGTVEQDIYDISKQYVLIPKGSEVLINPYQPSSTNEILNSRLGFKPTWIVRPDGSKIDLSSASTMDREGVGAVTGEVDRHILAQISGVLAYAMVGSKSSRQGTGDNESSYAGDVGEGARSAASPLAQKYLNVVPTVTVDGGISMRLITEDELYISPYKDTYEKYYSGI